MKAIEMLRQHKWGRESYPIKNAPIRISGFKCIRCGLTLDIKLEAGWNRAIICDETGLCEGFDITGDYAWVRKYECKTRIMKVALESDWNK